MLVGYCSCIISFMLHKTNTCSLLYSTLYQNVSGYSHSNITLFLKDTDRVLHTILFALQNCLIVERSLLFLFSMSDAVMQFFELVKT